MSEEAFLVKIKPTTGGDVLSVPFSKTGTVAELKDEVSKLSDLPSESIRLIYKGIGDFKARM